VETFSLLSFLGALAIFMFGIRLSRTGVQLLAGDRLRSLMGRLTTNRFKALITGILTTLILQSSTATVVMLVGFAGTGAITLVQAMGVILGADIGGTLVVVLLSIRKMAESALLFLVIGVILDILSKRKGTRYISMVFLGFGFIFFGMRLLIQTTTPLGESALLSQIFSALNKTPLYSFLGAAVFTLLVQNSATTLGLVMACSFASLFSLEEAIPIVLGANVGTSLSALFHSLGGGVEAKRVAFSHLLFKAIGALAVFPLIPLVSRFIFSVCSAVPIVRDTAAAPIALAHVGFNLILSIFFLPFIRQGAWLIERVIPEPLTAKVRPFGPRYLEEGSLQTPAIAFANAKREILRMAEIAQELFRKLIVVFEKDDREMMSAIEDQDDQIDILDREIKFYLAAISQENLTPEQSRMQLNLVAITSDLEEIGDVMNKNILELAEKKIRKGRHFSEAGWKEIADFHAKVLENFQLTLSTLTTEDESIARKISRHERHLGEIEDHYREAHLQRLHKGLKETIETSSIHLDLLSNLRRINSKLMAIVRASMPGKEISG